MKQGEIDQYDQDTLGYLTAAGVSPQLVERVRQMAKDTAHWKAVASAGEPAAHVIMGLAGFRSRRAR